MELTILKYGDDFETPARKLTEAGFRGFVKKGLRFNYQLSTINYQLFTSPPRYDCDVIDYNDYLAAVFVLGFFFNTGCVLRGDREHGVFFNTEFLQQPLSTLQDFRTKAQRCHQRR